MNGEGQTLLGRKAGKGIIFGVIAVLLLFFLMVLSGGRSIFIVEIPFRVVCGWAIHGWKALPPFFEKWQAAVLPLGCLLMAFVLAHRFIRRWVEEKRPALDWRTRHTAAVFSLILLGSGAAIALSGVVHQFFWLAGGKVLYDNRKSEYLVAMRNGGQLMSALLQFQAEKGRYPRSFEELELEFENEYNHGVIRRLWWLDSRDREVPEPWILLRPGSSGVALEDVPVIVSPVISEGRFVMVGYGTARVKPIRAENLAELLGQVGAEESEGGR